MLPASLKMVHITYTGGPLALSDMINVQVAVYFAGVPVALPLVKAARVRALGVTGAKRASVVPEVPTIWETGVPGYEHILCGMLLVPAATPKDVVARLNREICESGEGNWAKNRAEFVGPDADELLMPGSIATGEPWIIWRSRSSPP